MKKYIVILFFTYLAFTLSFASDETPAPPDQAKMMEYLQLSQPGVEHEPLNKLAGKWQAEISLWMAPNTDPLALTADAEITSILGNRFIQIETSGLIMGQPMNTMTFIGFDRRNEKYVMVGMDSQGTYYVTGSGVFNDSTQTIRMFGEDYDGYWEFTQEYYFDVSLISEDRFMWSVTFTNKEMTKGEETFTVLKILYKRVKETEK